MKTVGFKRCKNCGEMKSLEDFHRNEGCLDGRVSKCKVCRAVAYRNEPQEVKEKNKQRLKEYEHNPERIAYRKKYAKENQRGSKQEVARHTTSHGIRDGVIVKPICCSVEGCEQGPIEGHHPDYSKPTEVVWLCRYHHRLEHSILSKGGDDVE